MHKLILFLCIHKQNCLFVQNFILQFCQMTVIVKMRIYKNIFWLNMRISWSAFLFVEAFLSWKEVIFHRQIITMKTLMTVLDHYRQEQGNFFPKILKKCFIAALNLRLHLIVLLFLTPNKNIFTKCECYLSIFQFVWISCSAHVDQETTNKS